MDIIKHATINVNSNDNNFFILSELSVLNPVTASCYVFYSVRIAFKYSLLGGTKLVTINWI